MLDRPRLSILAWAGACAALFAVLAFLVHLSRAPLNGFDDWGRSAEHWARSHDGLVHVLLWVETGFATQGMVILTLLVAVPLWLRKYHRAAVYTVVVVLSDTLIYTWFKVIYGRDRPIWQDPSGLLKSHSFPSGHSASTAALAGVVIVLALMLVRRSNLRHLVCTAAVLVSFLVGLDRVLLGRHYPTDVLAGWLLGACITLFWLAIYSPVPAATRSRRSP